MTTIWKFEIALKDGPQPVQMPRDAYILFVYAQFGSIMLWAQVVPERAKETRTFSVHGTGHPINPDSEYVGTAMMPPFVWHVFELKPE